MSAGPSVWPGLAGKTALVTGTSGLIGSVVADMLDSLGMRTWRWDVGGGSEPSERTSRVDVTDARAVEQGLSEILARDGSLGTLVHAAAITGRSGLEAHPVLEMPEAQWRRVLEVNLTGAFLVARHVARAMVTGGGGSIALVGSVQGQVATEGRADYAVAKAGLTMLAKVLAGELATWGVRVNLIVPGPISEPQRPVGQATLTGGSGRPLDVAYLAAFLASDAAQFMTGGVIAVDGGASMGFRREPPGGGQLGDPGPLAL